MNLSASPYHAGKGAERERMLAQRARDNLAAVLFCNAVGGQDELVFDGHSVALDQEGEVVARAPQFEEALTLCTIDPGAVAAARLRDPRHRTAVRRERGAPGADPVTLASPGAPSRVRARWVARSRALLEPEAEVYGALRTGLRDYADKNGFERVVFGLSGGIDSALVALLAVDALGADRVTCVSMPSPFSSEGTQADARAIAENLGTELVELAHRDAHAAPTTSCWADAFAGTDPGLAEENLQARIRGNLVMALSNKFGWLVLTTGNKSRALGGLRDPLRRHGGRLRGAQGRVQGLGLPARAVAQRPGGAASSSPPP